jgi:protein-tyrosine-phosphatase
LGSRGEQVEAHPKARVLFLCTHNSARSQMAEGILRQIGGSIVEVYSAGTEPSRVHPDAIRTVAGMSIDISGQRSKHINEFRDQRFDYVVTVCDRAREACPYFPGDPVQIHWSFPDPSAVKDEDARLHLFHTIAIDLLARSRFLLSVIEGDRRPSGGL